MRWVVEYIQKHWRRHSRSPFARSTISCASKGSAEQVAAQLTERGHKVVRLSGVAQKRAARRAKRAEIEVHLSMGGEEMMPLSGKVRTHGES